MSRYAVVNYEGEVFYAAFGPTANMAQSLYTMLGDDAPFWPFESLTTLPAEILTDELGLDADFTAAPHTDSDFTAVNATIAALFASPPLVGAVTGAVVWGKSDPPPSE